jgi:hypothetical protein
LLRGFEQGWPSDVEALDVINAELSKEVERCLILDALTDCLETEACAEADNRLDHVAARRIRLRIAHELGVDLDSTFGVSGGRRD